MATRIFRFGAVCAAIALLRKRGANPSPSIASPEDFKKNLRFTFIVASLLLEFGGAEQQPGDHQGIGGPFLPVRPFARRFRQRLAQSAPGGGGGRAPENHRREGIEHR